MPVLLALRSMDKGLDPSPSLPHGEDRLSPMRL